MGLRGGAKNLSDQSKIVVATDLDDSDERDGFKRTENASVLEEHYEQSRQEEEDIHLDP